MQMELGNMMFGHSRGKYPFPDRDIVYDKVWTDLLKLAHSDPHGYTNDCRYENTRGGYEDEVFAIRPYWWGDDDSEEVDAPNFLYKPTGLEIRWYKYPFRDSYMNQELSADEVLAIFNAVAKHLIDKKGGLR